MWFLPPISQQHWIFLGNCVIPVFNLLSTVLFLCGLPHFLHWRLGVSSSREGHDHENQKRRCSSDLGSHSGLDRQRETWSELKFVESKDITISGWISCGVWEKERRSKCHQLFILASTIGRIRLSFYEFGKNREENQEFRVRRWRTFKHSGIDKWKKRSRGWRSLWYWIVRR